MPAKIFFSSFHLVTLQIKFYFKGKCFWKINHILLNKHWSHSFTSLNKALCNWSHWVWEESPSQCQWFSFYYQDSTIIWLFVNTKLSCSSLKNVQVLTSKIKNKISWNYQQSAQSLFHMIGLFHMMTWWLSIQAWQFYYYLQDCYLM